MSQFKHNTRTIAALQAVFDALSKYCDTLKAEGFEAQAKDERRMMFAEHAEFWGVKLCRECGLIDDERDFPRDGIVYGPDGGFEFEDTCMECRLKYLKSHAPKTYLAVLED